jgi:hypothetical protein
MDFMNQLQKLAKLVETQAADITTEEATKNTFVIPFIRALGYDVLDRTEVLPEFTVDVGCKKDEKVDYAVFINDKPTLLFQCKSCDVDLNEAHATQLRKCFHGASAGIGVLTNGKSYYFYSDLKEHNIMDDRPFLQVDLLNLDEQMSSTLKKLSKRSFELDQLLLAASELIYIRAIKSMLFEGATSPSLELVRFFAEQMYSGIKTPQVLDRFRPIVKKAFKQFVDDCVNDRFKSAANCKAVGIVENIHKTNNKVVSEPDRDSFITAEEFERCFVVDIT